MNCLKLLILVPALCCITLPAVAEDYISFGGGASFWNQAHNSDELEGGSEPGYLANIALGREYETHIAQNLNFRSDRITCTELMIRITVKSRQEMEIFYRAQRYF